MSAVVTVKKSRLEQTPLACKDHDNFADGADRIEHGTPLRKWSPPLQKQTRCCNLTFFEKVEPASSNGSTFGIIWGLLGNVFPLPG